MTAQSELHNRVVGDILRRIVAPVIESGGCTSDVMVILESVVAGVLTACASLDKQSPAQRDQMLMALESRVRGRLETLTIGGAS